MMSAGRLARVLRDDAGSEAGLSLPEVMIAVVIMFLVMASMGFAMVGALRSTQAPSERNNRSAEIAVLGTIFPSDVGSVTPGSTITAGGTGVCGSASNATYTAANTQPLISLPNPTVANPGSSVMYALYHPSAAVTDVAGLSLLRFPCTGTTAGSPLNVIASLQWVAVQSASVPAGSRTVTLALSGGAVSQAIASTTNGSTAVDFAQSSLTAPSVTGTAVDLAQSSTTAPSVNGTAVDFSQSSATAPNVSGTAVDFSQLSTTGNTTSATTSVSLSQTSSTTTAKGVVSGSPNVTLSATNASIAAGQYVTGTGIAAGTKVSSIGTWSSTTQAGTWTKPSTSVTLTAANANIYVGETVTGTGIAANTTVTAISGTALTLSTATTANGASTTLTFAGGAPKLVLSSNATASSASAVTLNFYSATDPAITAGQYVTGTGIAGSATVASTTGTSPMTAFTLSSNATATGTNVALKFYSGTNPTVTTGQYVTGTGIAAGTTVTAVTGTTPVTGLTLSASATTGTNVALKFYSATDPVVSVGQFVTGTGIAAGTTVTAVTGTTPVTGLTLSQSATATGSNTLSFGSAVSGTNSYCASYTGTTCKTDTSGSSAGDVITLFGTGKTAFDGHPCRVTSSVTPFTCTLDSAPAAAVSASVGYITATAAVCEAQNASVATTFDEPFSGTSYTSNCATAANVNNARVALHINVNAVSSSPAVTLDSAQNYIIYGDVP